jgi:hypothetical protein
MRARAAGLDVAGLYGASCCGARGRAMSIPGMSVIARPDHASCTGQECGLVRCCQLPSGRDRFLTTKGRCPRRTATRSQRSSNTPRRPTARPTSLLEGRLLLAAAAALEPLDDGATGAALFGASFEEATGDRVAYPAAFACASFPSHGLNVLEPSCSFNFPARPPRHRPP